MEESELLSKRSLLNISLHKLMEYKPENKTCQCCKQDFTIEPEDFDFYEKIKVPAPTFCPDCRMQRRFAWRNERALYHNVCAKTGKKII